MTKVELYYYASFGAGDGSDWFDWDVRLDGAEEAAYLRVKKLRLDPNECEELQSVHDAAYEEIKEEETRNLIDCGDEYARECTGCVMMDPAVINALVAKRDPHTMEYFELTGLSDEELEDWDANDLGELPTREEFDEDFEPYSPFDEGYNLFVDFTVPWEDEPLKEAEARETLTELLQEAGGDYSVVDDYVERCSEDFRDDEGCTLGGLALEIAGSLGLEDYVRTHKAD